MNGKDFTIGVLSVTAVVLLVGFVLLQAIPPQPVLASGQSGTVGEYVVSTAYVDDQCEILSIMDTPTQRVNFYQLNAVTNQLVPVGWTDLRMMQNAGPRDRGRRR